VTAGVFAQRLGGAIEHTKIRIQQALGVWPEICTEESSERLLGGENSERCEAGSSGMADVREVMSSILMEDPREIKVRR
jgi:hypothetical protein